MADSNTPILNEVSEPPSKSQRVEFDETSLERDPGLRISMWRHHVNHRDKIRRCYIKMGPYQPKLSEYPQSESVKHKILPSQLKDLEVGNMLMMELTKNVSNKEHMAIILRFVDTHGFLRERFFQIVHIHDTAAATLKKEICDVLARYNLEIHNMRGQGYDGASNMSGAFNGLQALFLRDCPYAYYVHCFAHRLQLACNLLKLTKFHILLLLVNVKVGEELIQMGTLHRVGTTRWSSHFDSICGLIDMYEATIVVLECIITDGSSTSMRGEAGGSLTVMKSFDFIFILHFMHKIMAITDLLCRALQQKYLDILSAMDLVSTTKALLLTLRNDGFDILLSYVKSFCTRLDIDIPDMSACYKHSSRSSQQKDTITFEHHFHYDIFNTAIDFQLEELNSRFSDETVELLMLSSALDPNDNFKWFV
ncbi:uncharacterized protein [Henckelia pumila]|uniref:uncharacterized protein n=1 Tax=Henckelia pumila TaxID=405737 RepID=UPI003C6DEE0C